jgi:patatin-related protein
MAAQGDATGYDARSEVRFAVVLYGGVSLAIYMNGIVQELFELVRATAPADGGDRPHVPDDDLRGAGPVYRKLGCLLDRGRLVTDDKTVRTRFVVDIITGTSAGGINGVFLAKALANDQKISALSDLWATEGDIARLLNDRGALVGTPSQKLERPPASLLSGQRMLLLLLRALDHVSRSAAAAPKSPYADEIDLWVTATDLTGRTQSVRTAEQQTLGVVRETNHRMTFHFLYDSKSDPSAPINLFARGYDPMLAFAARCTSSFPGAFKPAQLADLESVMEDVRGEKPPGLPVTDPPDWFGLATGEVGTFFQAYGDKPKTIPTVSFADGGYLDNKPVDLILETLPKRRAVLPVARRVLIVDPDPGAERPPSADAPRERTDLAATVLKVATLPRVQTIGADVDRILDLSEPCRARDKIYAALDAALEHLDGPSQGAPTTNGPAAGDEAIHDGGLPGIAYTTLRLTRTSDQIGEALARVGFKDRQHDRGSGHHHLATRVVEQWREIAGADSPPGLAAPDEFLRCLDLSYELRRINFLQARVGRQMKVASPPADPNRFERCRSVRDALDKVYITLSRRGRALRFRGSPSAEIVTLREALGSVDVDTTNDDLRARLQPGQPLRTALDAVLSSFAAELQLDGARTDDFVALAEDPVLERLWSNFVAYDEATFALSELLPGENSDINVLRVSPRDTRNLVDEAEHGPKLAGSRFHHFGGFFNQPWRLNDTLWGRLDAAERLIWALWPPDADPAGRDALVNEAQRGILADALTNADYRTLLGRLVSPGRSVGPNDLPPDVDTVFNAIRSNYSPPPPPDSQTSVALAARTARVADRVGAGLSAPGAVESVRTLAGRILRLGAALVELALPDRLRSILGRHLLDIALIAAVLMILIGGLVGGPGVTSFGWVVFLAVLGVKLLVELLKSWLERRRWWLAALVLFVALVAFAIYRVATWDGWLKVAGLLIIGSVIGLAVSACYAWLARPARPRAAGSDSGSGDQPPATPPPRHPPVVTSLLSIVLVAMLGLAGVAHLRDDLGERACRLSDRWYRTVTTRLLVEACAAHTDATTRTD